MMSAVRLRALAFAALLVLLLFLFLRRPPLEEPPADPVLSASLEVHFSRPSLAGAQALRGGPETALVEAIDASQDSVEMAIYDLDLYAVRDALLRADARGVAVRLVVESDNLDTPALHTLIAAGIPIVADGRPPLMHDKFTVIDGGEVWTGSMNYTVNDAYFNDNNLLRLRDPAAARAYTAEFEEMFRQQRFGALSAPPVGAQANDLPAGPLEIYFAPEDGVAQRIVDLIDGARQNIAFLAFGLTSEEIARALEAKAAEGVEVRGVIDAGQAGNLGSRYSELLAAGLDVRLDGNPDRMHHKVMVIDEQFVITGSYNFSRSAETQNDENIIVLRDDAAAGAYLKEFERIYVLATP
jgi:phosphatidylserine/phosphatidylglycerophosphate/cardiolipin synthase-like enzyme